MTDNNTKGKSLWAGLREVAVEPVKRNGNSFQVGPAGIAGGLDEELERRNLSAVSLSLGSGSAFTRGAITFAKDQCS